MQGQRTLALNSLEVWVVFLAKEYKSSNYKKLLSGAIYSILMTILDNLIFTSSPSMAYVEEACCMHAGRMN